jgi:hypothetical protein
MKRYYFQRKMDCTCLPVALANCYSYLGGRHDKNFQGWFKQAKEDCFNGPYLFRGQAVKELKLPLLQTDHATDLKDCGGILELFHPIFNLHAVFIVPINEEKCMMINSWIGPEIMTISWKELLRFTRTCGTHYYIKSILSRHTASTGEKVDDMSGRITGENLPNNKMDETI